MYGDDQLFLGDFGDWDATLLQEAFNFGLSPVMVEVARRMGWKPEDRLMMAMVIMAYCHCVLHIDGFAMWMW